MKGINKMINDLVKEAHENSVKHGFWEKNKNFGEVIALMHCELSEAYEEYRNHRGYNETYYEENGKYNTVIAMTKNRDNIDKIEKAYNKDFKIVEYLLSDDEINNKLDEYDKKIGNTSDNDEIKLLVEELNGIYKGRDDIKMVKIS